MKRGYKRKSETLQIVRVEAIVHYSFFRNMKRSTTISILALFALCSILFFATGTLGENVDDQSMSLASSAVQAPMTKCPYTAWKQRVSTLYQTLLSQSGRLSAALLQAIVLWIAEIVLLG